MIASEAAQRREAWLVEHVDSQPPLTASQRDHLRAVLGGTARVHHVRSTTGARAA